MPRNTAKAIAQAAGACRDGLRTMFEQAARHSYSSDDARVFQRLVETLDRVTDDSLLDIARVHQATGIVTTVIAAKLSAIRLGFEAAPADCVEFLKIFEPAIDAVKAGRLKRSVL